MLLERRCPGCHRPWRTAGRTSLRGVCADCVRAFPRPHPASVAGVDRILALWSYEDPVSRVILAAKAGGRTDILRAIGGELARLIEPHLAERPLLTWVPASPEGRRRRGFDQGRRLAATVGRQVGVAHHPAVFRHGGPQRGRSRHRRLAGPRLAVRPDWPCGDPDQVIVVDDVVTTGASLAHTAAALRSRSPDARIVAAVVAVRC